MAAAVGLARGRSGGVWGRRQPKVGEDRAHDTGVLHGGDETQATATARAGVTAAISGALCVRGRWTYGEAMPVVPLLQVGLSPLLQWIVLPPIVVSFVRRQLT